MQPAQCQQAALQPRYDPNLFDLQKNRIFSCFSVFLSDDQFVDCSKSNHAHGDYHTIIVSIPEKTH